MKKILGLTVICLILLVTCVGAFRATDDQTSIKADVEIGERMFMTQIDDIYINIDDYLGKIIKYEGIFGMHEDPSTGKTYRYVFRYAPGCCGNDAMSGFEVGWDGNYPSVNDWVEAVGKLGLYEEDGEKHLRINLSSLAVLPNRGAEIVTR